MDIGAVIKEQYQVVEHIGRGGMADVWSAQDTRLRRMVAIKTIAASMAMDGDPVALFENEARTIAQMEHPHILPIYDFGDYENSLYIVMRYVTGGSLEDQLAIERLSVRETLQIADAIAKALDHAHDQNVIHLDLKPGNILLDAAGSPYLADFGLATVLDPEGRARNPGSGTLLYMAPEQLTADTIDHRADIYSYCIMLFHMFTGQLPFNGMAPMALRQLQNREELPDVDDINPDLPDEINDILRLGTALDPDTRPDTHGDVVQQLREVLLPTSAVELVSSSSLRGDAGWIADADLPIGASPELREAIELYNRAVHSWQSGQGRFLLGVTHFTLIADTYRDADYHDLSIDDAGYQVLLRGALEYDYQLDVWWGAIGSDEARRWVCLHTIRSGTSPARIRALYRLETLPDDRQAPVIPRLVAQALDTETDEAAKVAALNVLRTRAKLLKEHGSVKLKTEYQGRLLNTMTRIGIQVQEQSFWQETVYGSDVDLLIAEAAFDPNPRVAHAAARTVGHIRSLMGVRYLSQAQQNGQAGALDALALVRDEVPALPDDVSLQARSYAWLTNTVNRLQVNPLDGIWRVALVLLAGWLAMGEQVYNLYRGQQVFSPQRWGNTIAVGVVFGVFIALTYIAGYEANRRLRGFWNWWQRLIVFGALGFAFATLTYSGYNWFYLQFAPPWDLMRLGGAGLAFGLVASALLNLRPLYGIGLTALMTYLPIYASFATFYDPANFTIIPALPILLLVGVFCGAVAAQRSHVAPQLSALNKEPLRWLAGAIVALLWTGATWAYIVQELAAIRAGSAMTWNDVLLVATVMVGIGVPVGYWLTGRSRIIFALTALASFVAIYVTQWWQFFDLSVALPALSHETLLTLTYSIGQPLAPVSFDTIFYFDDLSNIFTVTLPMVLVIALGSHLAPLISDWWNWIGAPRSSDLKRGEWISVALPYTLVLTAFVSVLALFSLKVNVVLALFWSAWGFVAFVGALATWRWAKWGVDTLLLSGIALIVGAFVYDGLTIYDAIRLDRVPALMQQIPIGPEETTPIVVSAWVFWGIWTIVLGVCTWGVLRRALWGGIGALVLLLSWYALALFSPLQGSVVAVALVHVVVLAFVLRPVYHLFEAERFPLWRTEVTEPIETEPAAPETLPISARITERQAKIGMALTEVAPSAVSPITDEPVTQPRQVPEPAPETKRDDAAVRFDVAQTEEDVELAISHDDAALSIAEETPLHTEQAPKIEIGTKRVRTEAMTNSDERTDVSEEQPNTDAPNIQLDVGRLRSTSTKKLSDTDAHDDEVD